jgi:Holliday junction DNA helicase RuvA
MIASINGIITFKSPESLIVETGGIGYQVFIPLSTYYQLPEIKESVLLHIHTHVREDALQLYGFLSPIEKQIFLLLTSVSGVGPKLARNILSGMDVLELLAAIRKGAIEQLRAIPGIGPKMAGRLVLELKEKAISLDVATTHQVESVGDAVYEDALSALINLGYPERETRRAMDRILNEANAPAYEVETLIKQALRVLSKVG